MKKEKRRKKKGKAKIACLSFIIFNFTLFICLLGCSFGGDAEFYRPVSSLSKSQTTFNVANTTEWNNARNSIASYGSNKNYTINVTAGFEVMGRTVASFGKANNVTVTIQGAGQTLRLSGIGSLLRIESSQTVILKNLTLRGHDSNDYSLVNVGGGSFIMEGGRISGNTASYYYGGGVFVGDNGIFTMNGGEISYNTAYYRGGGVYVDYGGTFTMSGGEISGNYAQTRDGGDSSGGGVFVGNDGIFTMNGGKISRNAADENGGGVFVGKDATFTMIDGEISGNNTYYAGGGVYVSSGTFHIVTGTIYGSNEDEEGLRNTTYFDYDHEYEKEGEALYIDYYGTAERGKFATDGTTWDPGGDLYTTNDTIKVVNGAIVGTVGNITAPVWRDGYAISLTVPNVGFENVTAQGWQISDTGSSGWTNFIPPSTANMSYNGKYLRYYVTSGGERYYSNTVSIRVLFATEREVTIVMWDSYGDGWDGSAALRINVNGTNLATVRLESGDGPDYDTFSVYIGDVVQIYWVSGSNDSECAFAVYYSDDPPTPMVHPSTVMTGGKVLVSKQYYSGYVGDNTLMGSFTVE
jgi:hypothetical protein